MISYVNNGRQTMKGAVVKMRSLNSTLIYLVLVQCGTLSIWLSCTWSHLSFYWMSSKWTGLDVPFIGPPGQYSLRVLQCHGISCILSVLLGGFLYADGPNYDFRIWNCKYRMGFALENSAGSVRRVPLGWGHSCETVRSKRQVASGWVITM